MRTAIRDITEGVEMGSVPGLSCSLYGGVDFGEDYRKVGCRKNCVCVASSGIRSPLKSWKNSFGSMLLWHAISDLKPSRNFKRAIDGSVYSQNRLDFKRSQTGRSNSGGRGYGQTTRTCNAEGAGEPSPQPERKAVSCRDTA